MSKIDQIYREASKLFARNGFEGVSMRDVAEACDVTLATLYYHFSSKEELHDEISRFRFEEFISSVSAKQKALPPGADTPSMLLALIFDAVLEDATLFNLMQRDLHYFDDDIRRANVRKKYSSFLALIDATVRRHRQQAPDETTVFALGALIAGYCELVQADPRAHGSERASFIQRHRAAMIGLARKSFDNA